MTYNCVEWDVKPYYTIPIAALIVVCHLTVVMCTAADDVTGWAQTDEDFLWL